MRSVRSSLLLVLGALASALVACSSGSDAKPPPPVVPLPVVNSFTAGPSAVAPGGSAVLSWDVASATTVRIEPGIGPVGVATAASVSPAVTTAYVLTASSEAGDATAVVTVSVAAAVAPAGWGDVAAEPQSVVTAGPRVHVTDAGGRPVAGMDVSFVVSVGGGSVERATAVTDVSGDASCGSWTLGPARGLNTVVASVPGLAPVAFTAFAGPTASSAQLKLVWGRILPGSLPIDVEILSTYSIASVTATIWTGARTIAIPLHAMSTLSSGAVEWQGAVGSALDGVGRGPAMLVVTAVDALGNSTERAFSVMIDRPPRLIVTAPLYGAVARPTIHIEARCEDDDPAGCIGISVMAFAVLDHEFPIATGRTTISQDVDLSRWGGAVWLHFYGWDSAQQEQRALALVYVNADPSLSVLHELPGTVLDVLGPRVLFVDRRTVPPQLTIRDTSTGAEEVLEPEGAEPPSGRLTPGGAVYTNSCSAVEWRAGSRVMATALVSSNWWPSAGDCAISVEGDYAAYVASTASGPTLVRRDLAAGLDATVVQTSYPASVALASNGDVAYGSNGDIYRWRDGATVKLTNDASSRVSNIHVATNGAVLMYQKYEVNQSCRIAVHDGSSERILSTFPYVYDKDGCPGLGYGVAEGWFAYTTLDAAGAAQVWREGAAGASQATFQSGASAIVGLAPDGTLLFQNAGQLCRVRAGAKVPEVLGGFPSYGKVVYRDGRFVVLLGNMVLTLPQ